jgi:hypothetical protein
MAHLCVLIYNTLEMNVRKAEIVKIIKMSGNNADVFLLTICFQNNLLICT